jgi:hypothetical protein
MTHFAALVLEAGELFERLSAKVNHLFQVALILFVASSSGLNVY